MRAIKGCDTQPELALRSLAHQMGYRFRLHRKNLPGKPDLVFISKHKVVFMHGCFWHCHDCGRGARMPMQNREYWETKLARNRERDKSVVKALEALGWKAIVIWECEMQKPNKVRSKLRGFLQ